MAGEHFQTKVANIKLAPLRQASSLFYFVCFCLLFFPLVPSTATLFERSTRCEFRRRLPFASPACALFSAAITTAASLVRRGRRREVKGTQARFSGQGRRDGSGDDWWIIQKAVVLPLARVEMFPLNLLPAVCTLYSPAHHYWHTFIFFFSMPWEYIEKKAFTWCIFKWYFMGVNNCEQDCHKSLLSSTF